MECKAREISYHELEVLVVRLFVARVDGVPLVLQAGLDDGVDHILCFTGTSGCGEGRFCSKDESRDEDDVLQQEILSERE
jgi:hypothetical protein